MPSYTLRNIKTKKERDVFCSWTELQDLLNEDPNLIQKVTAPKIVSGVGSFLSPLLDLGTGFNLFFINDTLHYFFQLKKIYLSYQIIFLLDLLAFPHEAVF